MSARQLIIHRGANRAIDEWELVWRRSDLPSNLCISIHGASIAAWRTGGKLALSLEPDLDKVSGVGNGNSNGT